MGVSFVHRLCGLPVEVPEDCPLHPDYTPPAKSWDEAESFQDGYDRGYAAGVAAERATMMAFIERQITEDLEIEGIQVENHRVKDANKCAGRLEAWKVIQDKLRYAK